MPKIIRVVWVEEKEFGYGKAMRVIESSHPRFKPGTWFDWGFANIAVESGYRLDIAPVTNMLLDAMSAERRSRGSK